MAIIETPRHPVAYINIILFSDGTAAYKYENLGPKQAELVLVNILQSLLKKELSDNQVVLRDGSIPPGSDNETSGGNGDQ